MEISKSAKAVDPRIARSRATILAATARLLAAGGGDSLTFTRIAAEAGIGRATLYRHWPEPTDLLLEAMEVVIPEIDLGEGPIRERLRQELYRRIAWFNTAIAGASIAAIVERAEQEPRIRLMRDRTLGRANRMLRDTIAQAVRDGELRSDTPADVIATALVGSLLFDRHLLGHKLTRKRVSALVDAVLAGWFVGPPL